MFTYAGAQGRWLAHGTTVAALKVLSNVKVDSQMKFKIIIWSAARAYRRTAACGIRTGTTYSLVVKSGTRDSILMGLPVINANVWKPNLWRWHYQFLNSIKFLRFPNQVLIRPFLTPARHSVTTPTSIQILLLRLQLFTNIFIRQNRQQDRQRTDYIHAEKKYTQH